MKRYKFNVVDNLGIKKIGDYFNISKSPIRRILVERNLLRNGYSNGKKIKI